MDGSFLFELEAGRPSLMLEATPGCGFCVGGICVAVSGTGDVTRVGSVSTAGGADGTGGSWVVPSRSGWLPVCSARARGSGSGLWLVASARLSDAGEMGSLGDPNLTEVTWSGGCGPTD